MKLKGWVLWVCVVALLANVIFLFVANLQKDAALVQLHEAKNEVEQLRGQVEQFKSTSSVAQSTENARLRAENQNLAQKFSQLQGENTRLRQQGQKLNQQLETTRTAAQQQQEQLQQLQTESQQASPAPEASADSSPAAIAQLNTCINNLRQIDAAKQQWALENEKTADAMPTVQDLLPYFRAGFFPVCPAGGTYLINMVAVPPTCSVPGHVLPQ